VATRERWAPLGRDGWRRRQDGWYAHPACPNWLRSPDGRWFEAHDVAEGRIAMTSSGPRVVPGWFVDPKGRWSRESDEIEEIRRRLEEVT
jgi:hypothetical protein